MVIFIKDGLHLSFGVLETKKIKTGEVLTHFKNAFGERMGRTEDVYQEETKLRMGDGIKEFKSEYDLQSYLQKIPSYAIFPTSEVHSVISLRQL